jgi:putative transposase
MYSRKDRIRAIELYIKYDRCAANVITELGYPSRGMLVRWYKEYLQEQKTGIIHDRYRRAPKYTLEQQHAAVDHYHEHGRCLARSIRALGYPSKETLRKWCDDLAPESRKMRRSVVQYTQEQKNEAVIALCSRRSGAQKVADATGVTRAVLYKWKNELLSKENVSVMPKNRSQNLPNGKDQLISEIESLKEQVRRLKLERDILEGAAELIKKDQGVDLADLVNREKVLLIDALRSNHPLSDLLTRLQMPRSSYYYQRQILTGQSKYEQLNVHIVELFQVNNCCYGYRRIHRLLVQEGKRVSEKIVRALMSAANLVATVKLRRKYNSYQGEITPAPENLLERDFHADMPNSKWLTDITEFHIPAGKAYLSPVVDCFDGMLVSWAVSTRPDAELVNTMLDMATKTLRDGECPIIHSDRGGHYRWPGWIERIEGSGLIRSMSKKGCSPDNAACEGVFGRIKNEMFYNRSWAGVSIASFMDILDGYLHWYNNKRIKMSLGGLSPVEYRKNIGFVL